MNKTELANQIRFALEQQLSAQNAHHQFEHACRAFTGKRICTNILPATGPVSAGGDQGRDFETFRSYLREELGPHGAFLGLVTDGPLAFICTLQKDGLGAKVVKDADKVMGAGEPVAGIYTFCTADVPKGQRAKIQKAVKDRHGVTLELIDAQGLAEQLADHDTYWIAEQYLGMPAALAPPAPADEAPLPDWYRESRSRWQERTPEATLGDLIDIQAGLRHATRHHEARPDLPFWLGLVRGLAEGDAARPVRQRARYELAVAVLRGTDGLRPADSAVRAFFDDLGDESDPERLRDAQILLNYAIEAHMREITDLPADWLAEQNRQLRGRLRSLLGDKPPPNARAVILEVLGMLAVQLDPVRLNAARRDEAADGDGGDEADAPVAGLDLLVDVDECLAAWSELVDRLDDAPLFAVESFSDVLALLTPLLIDQPGWREIVDCVDEAVERSAGAGAAAARARDRAVQLRRAGRIRASIHELHQAKVGWWSGDALRGALLAMLFIAQSYQQLELPLAAKQYALTVVGAVSNNGDQDVLDLIPPSLLTAADCDYQSGAWCSAVEMSELAIYALQSFVAGGADPDAPEVQSAIYNTGLVLLAARDHVPHLQPTLREALRRAGLLQFIEPAFDRVDGWSLERWNANCDEQITGRPFADAGGERAIRFSALGTTWTVRSSTEFADARAAERFAAAAQILLVELAEDDLCLVPAEIDVRVTTAPAPNEPEDGRAQPVPGNEGRRWNVRLTRFDDASGAFDPEMVALELLTTLSAVLLDASLLPAGDYLKAIGRAYSRGLSHKLAAGRPYDEMANVIPRERYDRTGRSAASPPFEPDKAAVRHHPELRWQDGPGPGYSRELAERMVANRYDSGRRLLAVTLPALRSDPAFQQVVAQLREDGWLDWHILMSALNIQYNWRLQDVLADPRRRAQALTRQPEAETPGDDPVPASEFTLEAMRQARVMALPSDRQLGSRAAPADPRPRRGRAAPRGTVRLLERRCRPRRPVRRPAGRRGRRVTGARPRRRQSRAGRRQAPLGEPRRGRAAQLIGGTTPLSRALTFGDGRPGHSEGERHGASDS